VRRPFVNRVRGGNQQLSANCVGCHGSPDHRFGLRHLTARR